jgi:hypothetical protein
MLVKKVNGNYIIKKVRFANKVRVRNHLVPKHFFYALYALIILIIELIFCNPRIVTYQYVFFAVTTLVCFLIFVFETERNWSSKVMTIYEI